MRSTYLPRMIQVLAVLLALTGCDPNATTSDPPGTCGPNVVQFGVGDGFLELFCGCNEPNGTITTRGNLLTCTLPASGTYYVYFTFMATQLQHQIISTGGPGFPPSFISVPNKTDVPQVHAVQLSTSGTYSFEDAIDNSLVGQIIIP